jgi:hypothetical protein
MGTTTFQSLVKTSDSTQKWGYLWVPVNLMNLNVEASAATSQTLMAYGEAGEGTAVPMVNDNSLSQVGLEMATGGVCYSNLILVPDDMDVAASSYIDLCFTADSGTTTRTHTWTVAYKSFDFVDDATNAMTTTFTAVDTAITGDTEYDTAYCFQRTPQATINASSIDAVGDLIQFKITATTISTSVCIYFGLRWKYAKRYM